MVRKPFRICGFFYLCSLLVFTDPVDSQAAQSTTDEIGIETTSGLVVKVDERGTAVHLASHPNSPVIAQAMKGRIYEVVETASDGWVKISTGSTEGYIPVTESITILETAREMVDSSVMIRKEVVNYALQFVGGRYVYGGNDPHTGVDCSGFTKYVIGHAAGVSMNRSSVSQAMQGKSISAEQMRPGDLLFYGGRSSINHVALYIGNGQIVHASSAKTGIKISQYNYRKPVKIINVLGN